MIRVEVPDAASAKGFVQSSQSVTHILGSIEAWLQEEGVDSATVWLDDTHYPLGRRPASIARRR